MALYWKSKLKIFGEDKAFQKITLADVDDDDLASLRAGSYMALPTRDVAGRAVMFSSTQEFVYKERQNMVSHSAAACGTTKLRSPPPPSFISNNNSPRPCCFTLYLRSCFQVRLLWYMVHAMLEDERVQQKGFVVVIFEKGFSFQKYDRKLDKMLLEHSNKIWPLRFSGFHYCFDSKLNEIIIPFALVMLGREMRARLKLHPGSRLDSRFEELAEFGILKQNLPVSMGGSLEFDPEEWLDSRRQLGL
jgi:hypothetical protein